MLTSTEQVAFLRAQGVRISDEEEALVRSYLTQKESLAHLEPYLRLFPRHASGPSEGCFVDLSFYDLVRLDALDGEVRSVSRDLALGIEGAAKARLLAAAADTWNEDGREVAESFLESYPYREAIERELRGKAGRGHAANVSASARHGHVALPSLTEGLMFGQFLSLQRFCAKRWDDREMLETYYVLKQVKEARNAACHRTCIVAGLSGDSEAGHPLSEGIYAALGSSGLTNSKSRKRKLRNDRMRQLVSSLYAYLRLASPGPENEMRKRLASLRRALIQDAGFFGERAYLGFPSYLAFIAEVIDRWFAVVENNE